MVAILCCRNGPAAERHARASRAKNIDAAVFTSYQGICYYSGFLYCYFGRKFGFVLTQDNATTVSAGIDGGQPWRRSHGDNIIYSDWRRDNFFTALKSLIPAGARRVGIEFDHVSLDFRKLLGDAFPGVEFVDVAEASMWMRTMKSAEEHALDPRRHACVQCRRPRGDGSGCRRCAGIRSGARLDPGHGARHRQELPFVELMDTWTWFQSGIMTDGAHNPVTNKKIARGDILSLNCFPMIFGYYTAIERTLFCEEASDAHLDLWEKNCAVMKAGSDMMGPGKKCSDIALALNDMYRGWDLLKYRSFGYGHSFGVLSHYYGREAGVELREDVDTVLEPGMVVSMEPMIMIPEGMPGAGGYREHDIFIITETGAENITNFPYGPEEMIIRR
jgi:creatinase